MSLVDWDMKFRLIRAAASSSCVLRRSVTSVKMPSAARGNPSLSVTTEIRWLTHLWVPFL